MQQQKTREKEETEHFTVIQTSLTTEYGGLDWQTLHDHSSPDQSNKRKKNRRTDKETKSIPPIKSTHFINFIVTECYYEDIPLTNRVRGPYRKLRTEFFPPRFMARAIQSKGKKRGSVTYSTDWENEVSKIFIISLVCVWGAQERFLFTRNGFKFLTLLESKTSQF